MKEKMSKPKTLGKKTYCLVSIPIVNSISHELKNARSNIMDITGREEHMLQNYFVLWRKGGIFLLVKF